MERAQRAEVNAVYFARGYVSINFRKNGGSNRIAAVRTTANQLHERTILVLKLQTKFKVLPDIKE